MSAGRKDTVADFCCLTRPERRTIPWDRVIIQRWVELTAVVLAIGLAIWGACR
jgi:hypothetical protein